MISKPNIKTTAKIIILFLLLYILYLQVFANESLSLETFLNQMAIKRPISAWICLFLCISLMPFNWLFELGKWWPKMRKIQSNFSLLEAWSALMVGLTVAMFTPNRVGESTGRAILVAPENRAYSIFLGCYGAIAQWIILILGGAIAFVFLPFYCIQCIDEWIIKSLIPFIIIIIFFLCYAYKSLPKVIHFLLRFAWLRPFIEPLKTQLEHEKISNDWLFFILAMALGRYIVYLSQYILILHFWNLPIDFPQMIIGIAIIYFLQTGVPLPVSLGLVARGSIAIFVFNWFLLKENALLILSATFSLWILNLLFPAIIGSFILIYHFFFPKNKNSIQS